MKVCHITSAHRPEDDRIFLKEARSLAQKGYEVYLVQQGSSYEKEGVHLVGFGEKPNSRLKRLLFGAQCAYQAALDVDADIYHLHDPELLPYGLKLKKHNKKVIFDSHERYTEQIRVKKYLPTWAAHIIARVYGLFESYVLRKIDAVILPCTFEGKNPFMGVCPRAVIISNAAILGEFFDIYDPKHYKIENSVCYIGGLTESRGITNDIIATYRAKAKLVLAGRFLSGAYEEKLRAMPEFNCVDYRGSLSRAGVACLLQECQIGLCTLKDEGQYLKIDTFGIKVYEYMSMAVPVILSHSPYNDKMVSQYQFGICVDPDDADEIAAAIRYLLDNPEEARRMGENGRRAVKEEFNWAVEEKKLLALYEDILKS